MQNIDYTALYEQNADFKRYVDRILHQAQNQRRRSLAALPGADGGDTVQGTSRNDS